MNGLHALRLSFAGLALAATALACGGKSDSAPGADFQIDEVGSPLVSDSAAAGSSGDDGACKDDDHDHKGHTKHRWKALDALDGVKDHTITLAGLPAGLSQHLLDKLHAMDANHDGLVTRDEVKAARDDGKPHHKKKMHGDDGDKDDNDDQHEPEAGDDNNDD